MAPTAPLPSARGACARAGPPRPRRPRRACAAPAPAPRASESACPSGHGRAADVLHRSLRGPQRRRRRCPSRCARRSTASNGAPRRGKRLCSEGEWVRACEGPHGRRFPYGDAHRRPRATTTAPGFRRLEGARRAGRTRSAVEEAARLYQADASGARTECVSEEGVYDLTGNVAEWVRRDGPATRPGYEHVLKGCYWAGCYHEPEPNCAFRNSAHPGTFRTYEAGFRCCRPSPRSAS